MDPAIQVSDDKSERIPPRARILAAAGELFYREGIRAVGVEAIAEAAGTNKMTLYRHYTNRLTLNLTGTQAITGLRNPSRTLCALA